MAVINPLAIYETYASGISATLDRMPWERIHYMVEVLHEARMNRRGVFVMGNGGSASTATHLTCDLNKNTLSPLTTYPRFRVIALNDSIALFSALANDCGYDSVFREQLASFLQREDVVVAISTSGNSPNVLRAVEYAKQAGAFTVGWIGFQGGKLADLVDLPIIVPSDDIEQIEDIHLVLGHMVTQALREYAATPEGVVVPQLQPSVIAYAHQNGVNASSAGGSGIPDSGRNGSHGNGSKRSPNYALRYARRHQP